MSYRVIWLMSYWVIEFKTL